MTIPLAVRLFVHTDGRTTNDYSRQSAWMRTFLKSLNWWWSPWGDQNSDSIRLTAWFDKYSE